MFLKHEPCLQLFLTPYFLTTWYFCLNKKEHFLPAAGKKSTWAVILHAWQQIFAPSTIAVLWLQSWQGEMSWNWGKKAKYCIFVLRFFFTERDLWQYMRKANMIVWMRKWRVHFCREMSFYLAIPVVSCSASHRDLQQPFKVFLRGVALFYLLDVRKCLLAL